MENGFEYYSAFVFYDEKGRRLSTFGEETNDGQLTVTIIPCSLKDEFSRKEGRRMYEAGEFESAYIVKIPIEEGMPKRTFIRFCKSNFFQKRTVAIEVPVTYFSRFSDRPLNEFLGEIETK